MKNFIHYNWRVARSATWQVALFWVILFVVGMAFESKETEWIHLLWIIPMLTILSHSMLLCNSAVRKKRKGGMKWLVIVDHYGDHKIVEFANEAELEDFLLKGKYYTLAYNEGFTRCAAMNYKQTNVVFSDI